MCLSNFEFKDNESPVPLFYVDLGGASGCTMRLYCARSGVLHWKWLMRADKLLEHDIWPSARFRHAGYPFFNVAHAVAHLLINDGKRGSWKKKKKGKIVSVRWIELVNSRMTPCRGMPTPPWRFISSGSSERFRLFLLLPLFFRASNSTAQTQR